jgi:hypothetical protein
MYKNSCSRLEPDASSTNLRYSCYINKIGAFILDEKQETAVQITYKSNESDLGHLTEKQLYSLLHIQS